MRNNVLLIVQDQQEPDLSKKLQHRYNVFVVHNWEKALQVFQTASIQLIICSVELCMRFKSDACYAHLPVIVISGNNSMQSKLKSLDAGADAFITTPVSWIHLDAQINNLLVNRCRISNHFALPRAAAVHFPAPNSDEDFIKQLNGHIIANMHNRLLNVDMLARMMNISRPTLYRKIKTITDLTPNELINLARLKKAADRLASGNYKVFEIARMVGFQSQSSFGKAFIKQFKVTPTRYLQMKKKTALQNRNSLQEKYLLHFETVPV